MVSNFRKLGSSFQKSSIITPKSVQEKGRLERRVSTGYMLWSVLIVTLNAGWTQMQDREAEQVP